MATADQYEREKNVKTSGAITFYDPEQTRTNNRMSQAQKNFSLASMTNPTLNYDLNSNFGTQGAFRPKTIQQQLEELYSGSGSGSGGNSGATQLGYAELAFKKQQDARDRAEALEALQFGRARDARTLGGFQNYYGGGEGDFNKGFDNLLDMIKTQGAVSEGGITKAYDRATTNIGEGYDAASGLGTSGFNALNQYLAQNQNNPYAGMQASVGSAPDALSNYLSAYGVSDQPVQGQIQADQLQAQQGAGNYQNLIDLLGATAQQGAASRGAESQMAQLLFNTGLGQERAGYQGQAANAQAQALAALQQQMFQSRFGVEGDRNSLANQLVQTILNAGGTVDNSTVQPVVPPVVPPFTPSTSYDVNRPVPTVQQANLIRNMPGQDPNELLRMLNARRGY